jgi:adenylate cyclase
MFVAADPPAAALAGLDLAATCAEAPDLPDVRVGLAHGPTFTVSGDYFGPAVNLASRLVATANAGSVVTSESFRESVRDSDQLAWGLPRARRLKGVGRVVMWTMRRADDAESSWLARLADAIR